MTPPVFFASHPSYYPEPAIDRGFLLLGQWTSQGAKWVKGEEIDAIVQHNQSLLKQQLRSFRPDVCLAGNLDFLQYDAEMLEQALTNRVPVAHYLMNEKPNYNAEQTPQQPTFRLITCSNWVKENLQAAGYPTKTTQTIYPGADVEAFYQAELPERDRLRIAYASLVAPYKGADVLVEALTLLSAMGIEFTATIAGGTLQPDFVAALKQFVEAEGLQTSVEFTGVLSRQELTELYQTHNVLVLPSRFEEPFGISQIEAMAAGLTLITSGTGGAGEVVAEHGQDGLLFESENPFDLAEVLSSLVNAGEEWRAIALSRTTTALEFSQAKATEQIEAVLLELVALKNSVSQPLPIKLHLGGKVAHPDWKILDIEDRPEVDF
ncbi:MAG: glycosyltransferase, partial [Leptolyngbyaceae cyanobacterium SU_3_3]|nr:glycosyltransferase [Leptolyngbyaceae cyanobacterium SU_3_3]